MIESLSISGFQVHDKIKIDFDPSITTLIGLNDCGKSTILRAIQWVCLNKAPKDFITWDRDDVTVKLKIDNHIIIRKKTKKGNFYSLDKNEFEAFHSDVPDSIASLINVGEVNFQLQFDSPFWISDTPGQVSKALNSIINLSEIDDVLANSASLLRKVKSSVEVSQERLDTCLKERNNLTWVEEANEELLEIEKKEFRISEIDKRINDLDEITTEILELSKKEKKLLETKEDSVKLIKLIEENLHNETKLKSLKSIVQLIITTEDKMKSFKEKIEKQHKEIEKKTQGKCPICGGKL